MYSSPLPPSHHQLAERRGVKHFAALCEAERGWGEFM